MPACTGAAHLRLFPGGLGAHHRHLHAQGLHVASRGHHQRHLGVELQDITNLAEPLQPETGNED